MISAWRVLFCQYSKIFFLLFSLSGECHSTRCGRFQPSVSVCIAVSLHVIVWFSHQVWNDWLHSLPVAVIVMKVLEAAPADRAALSSPQPRWFLLVNFRVLPVWVVWRYSYYEEWLEPLVRVSTFIILTRLHFQPCQPAGHWEHFVFVKPLSGFHCSAEFPPADYDVSHWLGLMTFRLIIVGDDGEIRSEDYIYPSSHFDKTEASLGHMIGRCQLSVYPLKSMLLDVWGFSFNQGFHV